ncbi:MAG TPA: DNA polymerase III subunit gamma/tau [Usitatibacter sp.]|jgi:DNA polymerase-3 subunit gamma/tau|nr:DNA polymerase III subunit gamma/tau [Usitatibacter sp.]
MTYQVLARKWRPRVFEEIVGQPHVVTALANALDSKRLHHAYLFTGTRGVGKTTLARILAKALNCETNGISSHPCGTCRACTEIDAGRFVDLLEVDAATNTKVDEMRELLDTAQYMPVAGRFKIYIIDEVHMLSRHAFNSMLKTLEEPPEHVKFILATTDPQRLPVTILSRCLQFNLKSMTPALIAGHLKKVLTAEKVPFEEPALFALGKAAGGSLRDSLSLLDQAIAHGGGNVRANDVADMLGALGNDLLWPLIDRIVGGDGAGVVAEIDRISLHGVSFDAALEQLASILHRVALVQAGAGAESDEPDAAQVGKLAQTLDAERVQVMYQIAILARRDLPLAPDEAAGFGMAMLRMLSFTSAASGAAERPSQPERAARVAAPQTRAAAPTPAAATPASMRNTPAASAREPAPASSPAPQASGPGVAFDGNWPAFVERLGLTGMAGMVARYGELVSFENNHLQLIVPESHRIYGEKSYQDKLKSELVPHFGSSFRLTVRVGKTEGKSVAAAVSREMEQKQARAAEAIEEDPFVRDLVNDLGAQVVSSSIRPPEDGGNPNEKR